jgi:HSP20 family protein
MTLVKFNRKPLDSSFNNLVDELFYDFPVFNKNNRWSVPVNIRETEGAYNLDVVAPGFEKENFKVDVDDNILTVSGTKEEVKKEGDGHENVKELRKEYAYSSFKRSFTLHDKIDASGIEAKYVNGVLTLNLPKKVEVKQASKQISIQ